MIKKVAAYSEILYHLINFRTEQFQQLKKMIGIDYDSFMILSVMGSHYLKHNNKLGEDWDTVWEDIRSSKIDELYSEQKLTIYAVANILNLPKETVRRKIELLKKKKLINHSTKQGLLPTNKTEELMKPFAGIELKTLSKFLNSLKKNGTLDAVLNFKDK
jgi:predicted transcriptional regulator